jgi:hypothetical protein
MMVDDAEESQLKGGRRFGALHLRDGHCCIERELD